MISRRAFGAVVFAGTAALLVTACGPREPEAPTIHDVITSNATFTTLAAGVEAAGIRDPLRGAGPLTVFAPRNSAFDALPAGVLDDLMLPENREELRRILQAHVVDGAYTSADLAGQTTELTTLAGTTLTIDGSAGIRIVGANNASTVVQPDIEARNGIIHVIDSVLLP